MRREDLIPGKWYMSTSWTSTFAIKFEAISDYKDSIIISEKILKGRKHSITTEKWTDNYHTFHEVPISEIALYLPEDHPDLAGICEECQGGGRVMTAKLYPSGHTEVWETCDACSGTGYLEDSDYESIPKYVKCINPETSRDYVLGGIYKTKGECGKIIGGEALYKFNTRRFIPATKEEYDTQSDTGLKEFPQTGYCLSMSKDLRKYLEKKYNKYLKTDDMYKGFAWHTTNAWTVINYSDRKLYTIEQLEKFLNPTVPKRWCIQITPENVDLICEFLKNHKHEYKGYHHSWNPKESINFYFYYPQDEVSSYCRQNNNRKAELVTTEQIMHVLTNNNQFNNNLKQQENGESIPTKVEACKICRSNLSIRRGEEIRATTIRCSKSKIKLGGVNSTD